MLSPFFFWDNKVTLPTIYNNGAINRVKTEKMYRALHKLLSLIVAYYEHTVGCSVKQIFSMYYDKFLWNTDYPTAPKIVKPHVDMPQ